MQLFANVKAHGKKGLRLLNRSFLFLERRVHQKPRWVFAFIALVTVLALSQATKVRGVLSIYELLPSAFPSLAELKNTDEKFNDNRYLILNILPQKALTENEFCKVRAWISHEALNNQHVIKAFSIFDMRGIKEIDSKIFYPRSLELNCEQPTDKTISLNQFVKSPWQGVLVDATKESFLVQFDFAESVVDPKIRAFSYPILKDFMERWEAQVGKPLQLQTEFLGSAAYESYLGKGNREFSRVHLLLLFVLLIFFRLFMGTWKAGLLYLLSLVIALIWVIGLMGAVGGSFDILTNALMVMIAVSTLQDLAFVAMDYMKSTGVARKSYRRLQLAGFFTSFTTMVGFGSLAISSLPMIRDFGIFAASGAFFEWVLTFFFLPLLTKPGSIFEHWVSYEKAVGFHFVEKIKVLSRFKFLRFHWIAFFVVLLPWGLHFYDEPKLMFPGSHIFRQDTDGFIKQMGWEYSVSVVFKDPDFAKDKIVLAMQKDPFVQKIDTAQAAFESSAGHLTGLTRSLAEREFFKMWRPDRYFGKTDLERYHLFLKTSEISDVLKLRDEVHALCGESCYASGAIITYAEFVRHLAETLFESLFVSFVLVIIILLFLAMVLDFPRPLIVVYSALWGPAVLLILIMVFRIPINMMTSLTASVVLGLTGDNIIEFMFAKDTMRFDEGMDARFPGAIVTSVMMSTACLVFLASPFAPPRTLGILFCLGFLLSLFGDYFVLRYLWNKKVHKS